jgi:predicted phage tail protein
MITILLYGHLGRRFGRVHRRAVASAGEAVRALCATLPGFRKALVDGGAYRVLEGGRAALAADQLGAPLSARNSLRIVPVVAGAGRGLGSILLGAAMIGFGIWTGGASLSLGAAWSAGGMVTAGYFATSIGTSLLLGGISQALTSTPSTSNQSVEAVSNRPSYAFDGAVNTAAQGNPVPVCYGQLIVGSQVISAGLSVEQISTVPVFTWTWKTA